MRALLLLHFLFVLAAGCDACGPNPTSYFAFFNDERPHQALGYCVPSAVYFSSLAQRHAIGKAA